MKLRIKPEKVVSFISGGNSVLRLFRLPQTYMRIRRIQETQLPAALPLHPAREGRPNPRRGNTCPWPAARRDYTPCVSRRFPFDIADRKPGRRKAACRSLRAVRGTVVNNEPFKVEYSLCAKAAVKPLQRIFSIVCRCKYCNCRHSSRSFPLQPIKAVLPEQSPAGLCKFAAELHTLRQPAHGVPVDGPGVFCFFSLPVALSSGLNRSAG